MSRIIQCAHCGVDVIAAGKGNANRRFCSIPCKRAHHRPKPEPARVRAARRTITTSATGTTGTTAWMVGDCQWCGDTFTTKSTGGPRPQRYCSLLCGRKQARHNRRARERTPSATPSRIPTPTPPAYRAKVMERDSYICHICNEPTLPEFTHTLGTKAPHPLAPTIDHVIPVSRGGQHTMDNVKCAHYRCNLLKSDTFDAA